MKVYNKKGLAWGIFWTALGLFSLYRSIADPVDFLPRQIKHLVIAAVVLLLGITGFVRAFSKAAGHPGGQDRGAGRAQPAGEAEVQGPHL